MPQISSRFNIDNIERHVLKQSTPFGQWGNSSAAI